jgi:acetylornithine deacetylase/succinyl-diaminopimelate desuccinylase-like protein
MRELAADPPRHIQVELLGAVDEEYRFRGITAHLAAHPAPDAAIVLEPTGLRVVGSHNGVLRLEVVVRGEAGHTSLPGQGRNAIVDSAAVVELLHRWADGSPGSPEVVTVTTIRAGEAINIVPDRCVLGVDVRVAPRDDPDELLAAVRARLAGLAGSGILAEVETVQLTDGGMHTSSDDPFALAALTAAGQAELAAVPYGSDGSKLARAGVPTVVFGPGSIADAHTDSEWVDVRDVVRAARTIVALVRALDGAS